MKVLCPCGEVKQTPEEQCLVCGRANQWAGYAPASQVEEDLDEALAEYQSRQRFERGEGA